MVNSGHLHGIGHILWPSISDAGPCMWETEWLGWWINKHMGPGPKESLAPSLERLSPPGLNPRACFPVLFLHERIGKEQFTYAVLYLCIIYIFSSVDWLGPFPNFKFHYLSYWFVRVLYILWFWALQLISFKYVSWIVTCFLILLFDLYSGFSSDHIIFRLFDLENF